MKALKEEAQINPPKQAVSVVYEEKGGMMGAQCLGELPRNRDQVSNMRRSVNPNLPICSSKGLRDPLFMVMEQCKLCESGDKFVRVVTASPEPMCLLATDQQLNDLVRFATNPNKFCVLSIDPTFSLGDFSVTCIAYRYLLVTDARTGESPIMLGPMLVHQRKQYATYHFFASALVGITPKLANILAFGTDGEEAVVKAFKQQFPFAIHLRCFRHMKQDIQRKLSVDMGFPPDSVTTIIAHIFGRKDGPTFFEGLVDANSEDEFDDKLRSLESNWAKFEDSRAKKSDGKITFHAWFCKYHSEEIKSTMIRSICEAAGLSDPPSEFCTNDSEAINSALKQFLAFKKSDWPVFNEKMRKFVCSQQEEVGKTIIGLGQYSLREEYQHFSVTPSRWFTALSDDQKKNAQIKLQQVSVDDKQAFSFDLADNNIISDDNIDDCDLSTDKNKQLEDNEQQQSYCSVLPVDLSKASQITGLPTLLLRQMWSKAADLLSSPNHIMPAPGCSKMARMVASSSQTKPHFVKYTDDGRFECDESCPAFLQRFICSHTVAAAENNELLLVFLENYRKYAKTPKGSRSVTPNYTQLSMVKLPRRTAGRKGSKAPKKKSIARRKVVPSEQRQPLRVEDLDEPTTASTSAESGAAPGSSTEPPMTSSPSLTVITTSSGNWNWNWDGVPSLHNMSPPYFPPSLPPSYPPPSYPAFYPPPMPYHSPLMDISNCYPYPYRAPGTGSTSKPNHASPSREPFSVKLLNGRIKVCAGCKGPHMKDSNNALLPPPHDICIGHCEPLSFINPHTGLESSKMGNAYYHVSLMCIRKKHPDFTPSQLVCSDEVKVMLMAVHFQFLWDNLRFSIH